MNDNEELLEKYKEAARLIEGAANLVVFTGAGISTSAGLPDYRGMWELILKGENGIKKRKRDQLYVSEKQINEIVSKKIIK